jgi:hypothetical protein
VGPYKVFRVYSLGNGTAKFLGEIVIPDEGDLILHIQCALDDADIPYCKEDIWDFWPEHPLLLSDDLIPYLELRLSNSF